MTRRKAFVLAGFMAAIGLMAALGWPHSAQASEIMLQESEDSPFIYSQCYAADDASHPGPAAYFGQDVCVTYEALNSGVIQVMNNDDGTTDVHWSIFQRGTATIRAQVGDAVLYQGPYRIEEVAQDYGNDADCLWTAAKGGDDAHAWIGLCADPYDSLELLTYTWELQGDVPFSYQAFVSGPGTWCSIDSQGGQYGPGCS